MEKEIPIEVRFKRLGREKVFGQAWIDERVIDIDDKAHLGNELKLLDTIAHETIHIADARLAEETVIRLADELAKTLFQIGYRRTHPHESRTEKNDSTETSIAP